MAKDHKTKVTGKNKTLATKKFKAREVKKPMTVIRVESKTE
jgi:hypothetical protein